MVLEGMLTRKTIGCSQADVIKPHNGKISIFLTVSVHIRFIDTLFLIFMRTKTYKN